MWNKLDVEGSFNFKHFFFSMKTKLSDHVNHYFMLIHHISSPCIILGSFKKIYLPKSRHDNKLYSSSIWIKFLIAIQFSNCNSTSRSICSASWPKFANWFAIVGYFIQLVGQILPTGTVCYQTWGAGGYQKSFTAKHFNQKIDTMERLIFSVYLWSNLH